MPPTPTPTPTAGGGTTGAIVVVVASRGAAWATPTTPMPTTGGSVRDDDGRGVAKEDEKTVLVVSLIRICEVYLEMKQT
jgi:hypothetical protein